MADQTCDHQCGDPAVEERSTHYGAKVHLCQLCAALFDATIASADADRAYENADYDNEAHSVASDALALLSQVVSGESDATTAWSELVPSIAKYADAVRRHAVAGEAASRAEKQMEAAKHAVRSRARAKRRSRNSS